MFLILQFEILNRMFIISLFIFVLGLIVGSFLNVVICRLETGEGIIVGRSHCPRCKEILKWFDLIPLLSFIFLKGKCRYCKKPISWQYPIVELATGLIFFSIFNFQFSIFNEFSIFNPEINSGQVFQTLNILNFLFLIFVSCILIIIFAFDLKHFIIPDKIIFPAIGIVLFYQLFRILEIGNWSLIGNWKLEIGNFPTLFNALAAGFLASIFFLSIIFLTHGKGMGMGDVKFAFLIGLILGWPNVLLALFIAFMLGAVVGLVLIFLRKKTFKSEVPFGPFLCVGTFLCLFYSEQIINWYWGLF